ncbi:hypothetical protein [Pseudonocardia hydrocarbonoxydans]|uniref:Uncharacterized protein n=1 Tax=Pseudonocardia hydrocarbonoxydans TaxID=76726 RepID=A0A4Y3WL14_9PSEU|nr:hypothetical protein [Pseudonocardia hydrocarbonoxydans]GEC18710.1 hypothetical protein PHY01_09930 [Pseudonocardia hydrocarbonoxydans]
MKICIDGASSADVEAARGELAELVAGWGHTLTTEPPAEPVPTGLPGRDERVIDPVSLTALIVSLPSATLAVADLVDRIRKRRRAEELIDRARRLAAQRVSVVVLAQGAPVVISGLGPDQLLELLAEGDAAGGV